MTDKVIPVITFILLCGFVMVGITAFDYKSKYDFEVDKNRTLTWQDSLNKVKINQLETVILKP